LKEEKEKKSLELSNKNDMYKKKGMELNDKGNLHKKKEEKKV
jgi:hypothetical protein